MWQEDMQFTLSALAMELPDWPFLISSTFPGPRDIRKWINSGSPGKSTCGEGGREGSKETELMVPTLKKLIMLERQNVYMKSLKNNFNHSNRGEAGTQLCPLDCEQ